MSAVKHSSVFRNPLLCLLFVLSSIDAWADSQGMGLAVEPSRVVLAGVAARQQLAVTLRLGDGSVRDVTSQCRFVIELVDAIGVVVADGVVMPRNGRTGHPSGDFPGSDRPGRGPGRALGMGAGGEFSDRRLAAALQGWLQHGGVPR